MKKISPDFGMWKEDISSDVNSKLQLDSLIKWARLVDQRIGLFDQAIVQVEHSLLEIVASLESIARIIIEKEVSTEDEINQFRLEFLEQLNQARSILSEQVQENTSKIWTPEKKLVPGV